MPNMAASNPNTHEEETRKIMLEQFEKRIIAPIVKGHIGAGIEAL